MRIKKTDLLVAELEAIADDHPGVCDYCREVLKESAQRLRDLDKIAEFYRKEAEKLGGEHHGRARRRLCLLPILFRSKQYGATKESNDKM